MGGRRERGREGRGGGGERRASGFVGGLQEEAEHTPLPPFLQSTHVNSHPQFCVYPQHRWTWEGVGTFKVTRHDIAIKKEKNICIWEQTFVWQICMRRYGRMSLSFLQWGELEAEDWKGREAQDQGGGEAAYRGGGERMKELEEERGGKRGGEEGEEGQR